MKFGVVVFPGTNCDQDCQYVLKNILHQEVHFIWHKETTVTGYNCLVLPGGFSYGDYLRTGAIARFSPIMQAIIQYAEEGGLVIGICNGFQILLEAGLLPGAMLRNRTLSFICRNVPLKVENHRTPFSSSYRTGELVYMPVAHGEGNYFADPETLERIEEKGQVLFRYAAADGEISDEANLNGSVHSIAGITNERGNVLGMMPHPERVSDPLLGGQDGKRLFESIIASQGAIV
jgi:phosphoribosylformylglycinamidine synthase subunit PurQ / glutaminase